MIVRLFEMERYGIAKIIGPGEDDEMCGQKTALRVENNFFKSLKDCVQRMITLGEFDKHIYFKILKNRDIVTYIHNPDADANFGYIYVTAKPGEQLNLLSHTNKLYNSMLECVTAKHVEKRYREELSEPPMCLKIAYFKVLKDSEIVSELHRSSE